MQTIDVRLRAVPQAPGVARRALDGLSAQLRGGLLDEVRLLVSELVTNSYRHGAVGPGGWIRLQVDVTLGTLRVEVCDSGPGFDPAPRTTGGDESGWGLYLVRRIADRWGVSASDTCCVWFEIDGALVPEQGRQG
jgi:anti-sigma regulatory factor (Ser/Thr protein kinase)